MRADLGVDRWTMSTPGYEKPLSRLTRLLCFFLTYKEIHFWPLEAVLPAGVDIVHLSTPKRAQTNDLEEGTEMTVAPAIDDHAQAILTALGILAPGPLSHSLTDYLVDQPGRCPACGAHPPTQGHAAECNRPRLRDVKTFPVLFKDSDICKDCGEPYGQNGFSTRCLRRHWRWQKRPCGRCGGVIDYSAPRFLDGDEDEDETRTVNPGSLVVARIVPPAQGRQLGWGLELINALSNKQPLHAACQR